ncbi:hypothetical protein PPL_04509 [Heterostelium album PN500]|uniref:Extradiol ring-cleavage dioxygenase class III enzyme subunit B domain-containing protein n=1 Tax=Heterostelium pallidum (strain ATCC 26659 / Pp 5 / PN500) TaxID=670386 RepID=D3B7S1_HETP5|nr:hypothetical protein PPL_04509 [Heterostelium album PN500]EFA82814.1 hypothetical protein PPL_04509 [Heterostelium album PN500]|eukprot:XP_020434931.1 hypothetical protein PPL_04509 [Heterostelium album PN500]
MTRFPVLFVNHGAPNQILDKQDKTTQFLSNYRNWAKHPQPEAILIVSAHWEEKEFHITNSTTNLSTIHDFYGFEDELYRLRYNPATSPSLINRITELFGKSGSNQQQHQFKLGMSPTRGLDHGSWTPLKMMYPDADIPVVQLSLRSNLSGIQHYQMGQLLQPLRDEGILIVCSGSTLHNLSLFFRTRADESSPIKEFEDWIQSILTDTQLTREQRTTQLLQYEKAPKFRLAHPREEHFIPLIVAAGAGIENSESSTGVATLIHSNWKHPSFCLSCFQWD